MLDDELKAKIREVLYSRKIEDKELSKFSGVKGIRQLRYNKVPGNANKYDTIIYQYKLEQIYEIVKELDSDLAKKIIDIIYHEVDAGELVEKFFFDVEQISMALQHANTLIDNHKNGKIAFGYSYYSSQIKIDEIAKAVDAG